MKRLAMLVTIVLVLGGAMQASGAPDGAVKCGQVGKALVLDGFDNLHMRVKLLAKMDPAKASSDFFAPGAGKRYVALRLRLTNVSRVRYDDSPSNGASVIDTRGREYPASIFDPVEPALGSPNIAPGDFRVGYITFEVPKGAKLRIFQFALNSGFADDVGEWRLC
jgi:hypothetical protein